MTFLYPGVLWAALAVLIPILIHLFNFRRPKRVLFSNVAFVRQVNKAVVRKLKLKQWLLLAARILAILALVFTFANPVLPGESSAGAIKGRKSVLIVLDNSLSMSAADGGGVWFQQAKRLATDILKSYTREDEFQVQTTGDLRLNSLFVPQGQALERVNELDFRDRDFRLTELFQNLDLLLTEARHQHRLVYFISDFQKSTVLADSLTKAAGGTENVQLIGVPVGERVPANIYVSDVQFETTVLEVDQPVEVKLTLNNASEEEVQNLGLRVLVEGKEVSIGSVESLRPGEQQTTTVTFTPNKGGWQSGEIVLDDPEVTFDNRRFFAFQIPQNQRLLLVEGETEDPKYLRLLFERLFAQYDVKRVSEKNISSQDLAEFEAVVLAGINDLSSGQRDRLASWVKSGGGVLFFPSEQMNVEDVNSFYQQLGIGSWTNAIDMAEGTRLRRPDLGQPLFRGVFESAEEGGELDGPVIRKLFGFQPRAGGIQRVLLQDRQNRPVLHNARVEAGQVFTFTVHPSLAWSDFPLKSSFVPILHRSLLLLTNSNAGLASQTIGDYTPFRLKTSSKARVVLRRGDQPELIPEQRARKGEILLRFGYINPEPGVYGVYQNDSLLAKIAFNLPDAESRLSVIPAEELDALLAQKGFEGMRTLQGRPEVVREAVQNAGFGVQLWRWFLLIALLMLAAEGLIVRFMR